MKIFTENKGSFKDKVNFVDENNVFVGYDMRQSCCEHADWFISIKYDTSTKKNYDNIAKFIKRISVKLSAKQLEKFVFDKTFRDSFAFDYGGGGEIFRIVNIKNNKEYYLTLYNCHNGYYSHGFEFGEGDKLIEGGSI